MENKKMVMGLAGILCMGIGLIVKRSSEKREVECELQRLDYNQELLKKVVTEFGIESDNFAERVDENFRRAGRAQKIFVEYMENNNQTLETYEEEFDLLEEEISALYDHMTELDKIKQDKPVKERDDETNEKDK